MEILGYISLAIMGIILGLAGAGGSILTIPILVYLLKSPIILATSYSLAVVGATALIATFRYRHHILFKNAIIFLIPSTSGVFVARHLMIPNLPHNLGFLTLDKALFILLLIFMSFAGYFMIKDSRLDLQKHQTKNRNIKIIIIGLSLGVIIGILGAGGGFLIIPTLVLFMGFSMREAVPTSLFIISTNSLIGFIADQRHFITEDWVNLARYLIPALLGMLIGLYIAKFVNGEALKKAFGYFILIVGTVILITEFIL